MKFRILLDPRAVVEVQEAIDYYEEQLIGLGKKFELELNINIKSLAKNPFFQTRYDIIQCLPLKKYPFMIHFSSNESEKTVYIHAVINTQRDPKEYWVK